MTKVRLLPISFAAFLDIIQKDNLQATPKNITLFSTLFKMAQFSTLPEDIHYLIIKQLFENSCTLSDFRSQLYLLAVNNTWRNIALPLVYQQEFIQYGQPKQRNRGVALSTEPAITTNIGLLQENKYAKSINIKIYYEDSPIHELNQIIEVFSDKSPAQVLDINLSPHISHNPGSRRDAEQYRCELFEIATKLAGVLPDTNELNFNGITNNHVACIFYGQIVAQYVDTLQIINSNHSLDIPRGCTLTKLKYLRMNFDYAFTYPLPAINPSNLEYLGLLNIGTGLSWNDFQPDSSDIINFANLTDLRIRYFNETASDQQEDIRLVFPKLETLEVSGPVNSSPILLSAELPDFMKRIRVYGNGAVYKQLIQMKMPGFDQMELNGDCDDSGHDTVEYMSQASKQGQNVSLKIKHDTYIAASDFTCPSIVKLSLCPTISLSTLLAIVSQLPKLECLSLQNLTAEDTDNNFIETELKKHQKPFDSKMTRMAINFDPGVYENMPNAIIYLIIKMPHLRELVAPHIYVKEFNAKAYVEAYPHIRKISCRFGTRKFSGDSRTIIML
ncbi:hypothetical protein BX667DRAFT_538935 [Coemansia mojavensis]|nr:hypothetical protein BX667DRAFT_538935 [Coemansia mojavensis]